MVHMHAIALLTLVTSSQPFGSCAINLQNVLCCRYGKSYDELDSTEKQSVGGTKGGRARADGAGSEGMAEMGKQGGNVTKDDTSSW